MPEGIFEVTPREYCSSTLGGVKYGSDQSNRGIGSWGGGLTYYNVHYIPFPIASIKSVLSGVICGSQNNSESTQVGMWSELDPTWNDAKLAALKAPDGSIPLGPLLPLQCAAEYARMQVDSNYFGSPWCTGGSGQTYPLTGYVSSGGNPAKDTALTAARLLDEMYRAGAQKKTWGTLEMVCYGVAASVSVTPKNGHRMQQVAPRSEKGNHRIGDDWSASSVGVIGTIPGLKIQGHEVNNNNYIYVDWKYKECCAF